MAKEKYIISVVIVTYNAAKTLQKCLNSIYEQSCKAIEIIVMDGDSNDGTKDILEQNTAKIAFWKSEKDSGIYDAMNKAISHITTERVIFIGADDLLLPDFSSMTHALKNPQHIYYSNVIYKDVKHSGYISPYSQAKSGIFHQSIIYPAAVFKKYIYNVKYKIAADYALNMRCYKDPLFNFEYLDYTIALYNDTGISSNSVDIEFEKDKGKLILDNYGMKIWLRYIFRRFKSKIRPTN
jgi:glycosyltransferase involved in cell wall biosynthesis